MKNEITKKLKNREAIGTLLGYIRGSDCKMG